MDYRTENVKDASARPRTISQAILSWLDAPERQSLRPTVRVAIVATISILGLVAISCALFGQRYAKGDAPAGELHERGHAVESGADGEVRLQAEAGDFVAVSEYDGQEVGPLREVALAGEDLFPVGQDDADAQDSRLALDRITATLEKQGEDLALALRYLRDFRRLAWTLLVIGFINALFPRTRV